MNKNTTLFSRAFFVVQKMNIGGIYIKEKFRATSIRLCRYLYGLGFDKESEFIDGKETWLFKKSCELDEALVFYFQMREKLRNINKQDV